MMKTNWKLISFAGYLVLYLAACNQIAAPAASEENIKSETPITQPTQSIGNDDLQMTSPTPPTSRSGMDFVIEKAKEDLAQRLSISINQIDLIEAEAVTWPNASLGCPQPGMVYAEVLTPGYLVLLRADNKEYEYHASRGTEVIYCKNPMPPVPGTPEDI